MKRALAAGMVVGMALVALVAVAMAIFLGCTSNDPSRHALESAGYTKIELRGYSYLGCGDDDAYHTKFTAINPAGAYVNGIVCCGMFKGCTVRF